MKTYAFNRKAKYDYEIIKTFEAGIVLSGAEVKAVRNSNISLKESFVSIDSGELWLKQTHISNPPHINSFAKFEETRKRKLLMKKAEISKLSSQVNQKGYTLVALKIYQSQNSKKLKVEIALAKGKKSYEKKNTIKERDISRETSRILKEF